MPPYIWHDCFAAPRFYPFKSMTRRPEQFKFVILETLLKLPITTMATKHRITAFNTFALSNKSQSSSSSTSKTCNWMVNAKYAPPHLHHSGPVTSSYLHSSLYSFIKRKILSKSFFACLLCIICNDDTDILHRLKAKTQGQAITHTLRTWCYMHL